MIKAFPGVDLSSVLTAISNSGSSAGSLPPGYIGAFLPGAIPDGWAVLDGQSAVIADNPVLYALFGDRYSNAVDEPNTRANAASLIPAMTANDAPAGYTASASSVYSASYPAYEAFDSVTGPNTDSSWCSANAVNTGWLQILMPAAKGLTRYAISSRDSTGSAPGTWTLQGTQDGGTSWDVLDSRTGESNWSGGVTNTYELDSSKLAGVYNGFRLNVTAPYGTGFLAISQLQLFGGDPILFTTPTGQFGLPNLSSSPTDLPGGVWCVKKG